MRRMRNVTAGSLVMAAIDFSRVFDDRCLYLMFFAYVFVFNVFMSQYRVCISL